MKTMFCILLLMLMGFHSKGQAKDSPCSNLKYDTLSRKFILEFNGKYNFYTVAGSIAQGNLMFVKKGDARRDVEALYKLDTVILTQTSYKDSWGKALACINKSSLSRFFMSTDAGSIGEEEYKKVKTKLCKLKNGLKYLCLEARIVTVDTREGTVRIPKFAKKVGQNEDKSEERSFKHVLLLIAVLEYKIL